MVHLFQKVATLAQQLGDSQRHSEHDVPDKYLVDVRWLTAVGWAGLPGLQYAWIASLQSAKEEVAVVLLLC